MNFCVNEDRRLHFSSQEIQILNYQVLNPYLFLIYFTSILEETLDKNVKIIECGEVLVYLIA